MTRTVLLSVALSVIHNRLVCSFDNYRDFLNFVVGRKIPLWDVERAREAVATSLKKKYPELVNYPPPEKTDSGNANKYVKSVAEKVGYTTIRVAPYHRHRVPARTASSALKEL